MKNMKNENAVSPVIGVILMVVITVIIAAILAVFAFGIGGPAKAPETQLRYLGTAGNLGAMGAASVTVNISNTGGDSLILKNERLTIIDAATGVALGNSTMDLIFAGNTYLAPGISLGTVLSGAAPSVPVLSTVPARGNIIEIQVLDIPTGQMVSNARVTVQ